MANKRGPKNPMSDEHKAALAVGRAQSRVVRDYLAAVRANKPKRGRKRTTESITSRLAQIDAELAGADPLVEVKLIQERMNLRLELENKDTAVDIDALEKEFVGVARDYSDRQGISYAAWREFGLSPAVLRKAGITASGAARPVRQATETSASKTAPVLRKDRRKSKASSSTA